MSDSVYCCEIISEINVFLLFSLQNHGFFVQNANVKRTRNLDSGFIEIFMFNIILIMICWIYYSIINKNLHI